MESKRHIVGYTYDKENGANGGGRTHNILFGRQVLCQLSYERIMER